MQPPVKPNPDQYFLIVGAMKCGTTTLFYHLAAHPAICPAKAKEPEFFSSTQWHKSQLASYEELLNFDSEQNSWAMEASTGYTKFTEPDAAQRIYDFGIRPKLVYLVRNPFDRIESHFNSMMSLPNWHDRIDGRNLVQTSNYFRRLEPFVDLFGKDQILVLQLDELASDSLGAVNRVCRFLELPEMQSLTTPQVLNANDRAPDRNRVRLIGEQRSEIHAELNADMQAFGQDFGINVARWGFDGT